MKLIYFPFSILERSERKGNIHEQKNYPQQQFLSLMLLLIVFMLVMLLLIVLLELLCPELMVLLENL